MIFFLTILVTLFIYCNSKNIDRRELVLHKYYYFLHTTTFSKYLELFYRISIRKINYINIAVYT